MRTFWRPGQDQAAGGGAPFAAGAGPTSVPADGATAAPAGDAPAVPVIAAGAAPGVDQGRLEVVGGAAEVRIRADASLTTLYRVEAEGPLPRIEERQGRVRVAVSRGFLAFDWHSRSVEIALNPAVPWSIQFSGGAWKLRGDLGGLDLREFAVSGGASQVVLSLPAPRGLVPIRFKGGASKVTLQRPSAVPARVVMRGGASKLSLDKVFNGSAHGEMKVATPGFDAATGAYDIHINGGASKVSVSTT
jgi:hypothetical protein